MSVLIIDLDDLKAGSCSKEGEISPAELELEEDTPFRFEGPLRLKARISTTDHLSFYLAGELSYTASGECRRCLKEMSTEVESELRGMFAFPEALDKLDMSEKERQEQGIMPLEHGEREIKLAAVVRESLVLEYPVFVQCKEDCRGLCPRCGAILNDDSCDCGDDSIDPRWSKLLELKNRK